MGRRRVLAKHMAPPPKPLARSEWTARPWLQPWSLAIAMMVAALGLSLVFFRSSSMIDYDFYVWIGGAKTLQQEGVWAVGKVYKEPLLSLLLNLVAPTVGGDYEQAGKAISLGFGSVAVGLLFLLASDMLGSRLLAALAALLVAAHPQILYYATHPFSEALYLCLIMLAMLCFWRAQRGGGVRAAAASGVVLGLAFLTRIPGIASALALFFLALAALAMKRFRPPAAAVRFVALLVGFMLLAGPFWVSIRHQTGQWRLSNKVDPNVLIREAYSAHDPAQKVENYERLLYGGARASGPTESGLFTAFLRRPGQMLAAYGHQLFLGLVLAHSVFPLVLVALGLAALLATLKRDGQAGMRAVVYLSMLAPFFAYPLGHVELRYMVPLIPVFVLLALEGARWAASGLAKLAGPERRQGVSAWAGAVLAVVAAVVIIGWSGRELAAAVHSDPWSEPIELKHAGLWLKARAEPDAVIMARKPMTAFYAERPWVPLPYTDYDGLLLALRERRVSYLVMDEIFGGRLRPQLRFLLYDAGRINHLKELAPVHVTSEPPGRGFIIYRVIQERLPAPAPFPS